MIENINQLTLTSPKGVVTFNKLCNSNSWTSTRTRVRSSVELMRTARCRPEINTEPSEPFCITKSFYARNIVTSQSSNICGRHSLSPPGTPFYFLTSPFSKCGTESCPPSRKWGLTLWKCSFPSTLHRLYFSKSSLKLDTIRYLHT